MAHKEYECLLMHELTKSAKFEKDNGFLEKKYNLLKNI